MSKLQVYTASAGAGKTYTLALQYLALALRYPEESFRHILAMTFTNKATNEMKERIVVELYRLTTQPDDSSLLSELARLLQVPPEEVPPRAQKALSAILGDYSSFKISTIDAFFQEVVRSFAFELNFGGNFKVETDTALWLQRAVVLLLHHLADADKEASRKWIHRLAQENIEEGGSMRLDRILSQLGLEIFKEKPLQAIQEGTFPTQHEIEESITSLRGYIQSYYQERNRLAGAVGQLLQKHQLSITDFKGGKAPANPLYKVGSMLQPSNAFVEVIPTDKALIAWQTLDGLLAKTAPRKTDIEAAWADGLDTALQQLAYHIQVERVYCKTAQFTLQSLSLLGTLGDIQSMMMSLGRDTNTLLLSSTEQFIQRIIDKAEAPFIYERLGTQIQHLMLDEFQDTARLQWNNIAPLLSNALAEGHDNLIVGDVKQSIYKFRNCDRSILGSLLQLQYPDNYEHTPLINNWRSTPEVVRFNNQLFLSLPQRLAAVLQHDIQEVCELFAATPHASYAPSLLLPQDILQCYAEASQKIAPPNRDKRGGVECYFYTSCQEEVDAVAEEAAPLPELIGNQPLLKIPEVILSLVEQLGYNPADIAILTRTNREVTEVAQCLLEYVALHPEKEAALRFVSGEALSLTGSPMVRFIITLLKAFMLRLQGDYSGYQVALLHYEQLKRHETDRGFEELFEALYEQLPYRSLYNIVELAIGHYFKDLVTPTENPYLTALLDELYNYHCDEVADLNGFLDWWSAKGEALKLPSDGSINAVTLMTIHKSKGLGFPIVMLPFLNWELLAQSGYYGRKSFLWCTPPDLLKSSISHLPTLAPITLGKELAHSLYAPEYFAECTDALIDKLNLFYVATTRAKKGLILWIEQFESKEASSYNLSQHLDALFAHFEEQGEELFVPIPPHTEEGQRVANIGELPPPLKMPPLAATSLEEHSVQIAIKTAGKEALQNNVALQHGAAMHYVLSLLTKLTDLPQALEIALQQGKLLQEEREAVADYLQEVLSQPRVAWIFDGSMQVLNEQTILIPRSLHTYRPDRILIDAEDKVYIVDYKFGAPLHRYRKQVHRYMELVAEMGYRSVAGYLCYFSAQGVTLEEVVL